MAADWRETTIGDLLAAEGGSVKTGPFGTVLKASEYSNVGVPLISVGEVGFGSLRVHEKTPRAPREVVERLPEYVLKVGDIVFGRKGAVDRSAMVKPEEDGWFLGSDGIRLRLPSTCDARFVAYHLQSPQTRAWLTQNATGTTMASLNQATIERIPVFLPPLPEQRTIAHILGTLDDKIDLNRRMNETLEAMARALFKSWFVDFDPVRAKAADLIREGVLEIGDGYRAKNSELLAPGLPFIRAGNLGNGFDTQGADVLHFESAAKAGRKLSQPGDVAFTSKGTIGRFARVTEFTGPFVYSPQICFWRSLDWGRLQPSILYCWMKSDDMRSQIDAVAGQTDMAPYVSLRDQRAMEVPVFPPSQLAVARQLDPILLRQARLDAETKTLTDIRDMLLPKLITGEIPPKRGGWNTKRFA
jgi:type I restriction enzyme S subunit